MTLTPEDIHKKQFSYKMRGYNIDEVNDFLAQITKDYQIVFDQNKSLKKKLEMADHDLTYYDDLKNSMNQSIIVAQEAADKVKSEAQTEANDITKTAQVEADKIVAKATNEANQIMENKAKQAKGLAIATDDFRDNIKSFRKKMIGMLNSQLEFAESSDWNKLLDSSSYQNYDEIEDAVEKIDKKGDASVESNSKGNDDIKDGVEIEPVSGDYSEPTVQIYPNRKLHK